jgi:hypothetical protein
MTNYDIDETLEMNETIENALDIPELMNNIFLDEFNWDDDKNGILLEFDEIPERTFETFKIGLHFKEREILNYGVFDEVELFDIRVIPSNLTTSVKWLKKNFQKICKKDYVTPLEFNEFVQKFKELDEIEYYRDEIQLTTEILIKEYQNNNLIEEYWHLQASIDLYIEEN